MLRRIKVRVYDCTLNMARSIQMNRQPTLTIIWEMQFYNSCSAGRQVHNWAAATLPTRRTSNYNESIYKPHVSLYTNFAEMVRKIPTNKWKGLRENHIGALDESGRGLSLEIHGWIVRSWLDSSGTTWLYIVNTLCCFHVLSFVN
jgi:hypothetical protein